MQVSGAGSFFQRIEFFDFDGEHVAMGCTKVMRE